MQSYTHSLKIGANTRLLPINIANLGINPSLKSCRYMYYKYQFRLKCKLQLSKYVNSASFDTHRIDMILGNILPKLIDVL